MAKIAGVKTTKNLSGEVTHITIDVKKHKEKLPMLTEMGLIPKSKFMEEWDEAIANGAMSPDELGVSLKKYVRELWKK